MTGIFALLTTTLLHTSESFLTNDEYAKLLYQNPRGIGCDKCHGPNGEGKVIATYRENGIIKALRAPRINNISAKRFYKALQKGGKLMPEYYLTDREKAFLYLYLSKANQQKENNED
ncbi:MAG: hypothetical protein B6D59_03295 [Campylobacteraceae bacterium 4484_4]|nr:MAG: hypothetical protein B6D59_03295 [Campylobacteraceae bacterium 4484_4]